MNGMRIKPDVKYRFNGLPPYHMRFGPRQMCAMSSFPSYRDRMIVDDYGLLIDPRYGSPDINWGTEEIPGSYIDGYLSVVGEPELP